ncbi:pyridoxamine 5'-phosphate oxidase family protein [Glaciecola sp. 1036]|uniref:pyridoxamine 5'-phosphate oxidase family protein n=1 Tax=Alteromonadaceae TaxID=72275 RepID=UPI003D040DD0
MTAETVSIPRWRQALERSLRVSENIKEANYFQLATVSAIGLPQLRTVVFRGFEEHSNNLFVVTDLRSSKVSELTHSANAQVAWYFTKTREQFRISVSAEILSVENLDQLDLVRQMWEKLSDTAKTPFYSHTPGIPFDDKASNEKLTNPDVDYNVIPANFAVLRLCPVFVDYLDLKTQPHTRIFYRFDDANWTSSRVIA